MFLLKLLPLFMTIINIHSTCQAKFLNHCTDHVNTNNRHHFDHVQESFIEIINSTILIDHSNYHKWIRPYNNNDNKVEILVNMQVDRFAFYNDIESVLEIQALLDFQWKDDRLKFNNCQNNQSITFEGNHYYSQIWTPNLRVSRSEDIDVFNSVKLTKLILLRVSPDGQVLIRLRSNINLICVMNYQSYPFDEQTCQIRLISNDLTDEHLILKWNQVSIDDHFYMSGFLLKNYSTFQGHVNIKQEHFSTVMVELILQRQFVHYMLVLFLPSILIVATSWVSFWIDIASIPGRVALSITTLLAMVTLVKESKHDIPKVSYIKAIDLWFAGCIVTVFLTLIEYVIVCYVYREERNKLKVRKRIKRSLSSVSFSSFDKHMINGDNSLLFPPPTIKITSQSQQQPNDHNRMARRYSSYCLPTTTTANNLFNGPRSPLGCESTNNNISSPLEIMDINHPQTFKDTPQEVAESIDRKCRYLFPLAFTLFNLIYWSYL